MCGSRRPRATSLTLKILEAARRDAASRSGKLNYSGAPQEAISGAQAFTPTSAGQHGPGKLRRKLRAAFSRRIK